MQIDKLQLQLRAGTYNIARCNATTRHLCCSRRYALLILLNRLTMCSAGSGNRELPAYAFQLSMVSASDANDLCEVACIKTLETFLRVDQRINRISSIALQIMLKPCGLLKQIGSSYPVTPEPYIFTKFYLSGNNSQPHISSKQSINLSLNAHKKSNEVR